MAELAESFINQLFKGRKLECLFAATAAERVAHRNSIAAFFRCVCVYYVCACVRACVHACTLRHCVWVQYVCATPGCT